MEKSKVSIIIPTYNCEEFIAEAIDSVLEQTYMNKEIIVIDDGSSDNTKEVLKKYEGQIIYLYQSNHGVAVARNKGITQSSGKYISFLDSDNKWMPNLLADSIRLLEEDTYIGLVHSGKIRISEDGTIIERYIQPKNLKHLSGKIFKNLLLRKASINLSSVVVRKSCLMKVGVFDTHLSKIGCEDRDLLIRIAKHCYIEYLNEPTYYGRFRKTSMSANQEKMLKGRYYIVNKFCPAGKGNDLLRNRALSAIHLQRGDSFAWRSQYQKALKQYSKAISEFPVNITLYIRILKVIIKKILKQ